MRIPNVGQVLRGLGRPAEYQVIKKVITDHEVVESTAASTRVSMFTMVMTPRALSMKPEGQRKWKWRSGWSDARQLKLELDWTLIGPDGVRYRVMKDTDNSQFGFYEYELVQTPFEVSSGA